MKIQPWESNVMLAGLTRGIWMEATAIRSQQHRGTLAAASSRRRPPVSDAERPDLASKDRETRSTDSMSDHRWRADG